MCSIPQWWYLSGFLSKTFSACLYKDSKGLMVVGLACPQQVIQYEMCEKMRASRNIFAASVEREDLIRLKFAMLYLIVLVHFLNVFFEVEM